MKSVLYNKIEIIVKKSKFIAISYNINNLDDVKTKLEEIKKEYKDATHICYAYIIGNQEKANDDNEPCGTAGIPILNVLKKENLNNVLSIVIRYFGGIKLGANGLIRAYSTACKDSLNIIELKKGIEIEITFNYIYIEKINYYLINSVIINKSFDEEIKYIINITYEEFNKIENNLNLISKVKKIREIYL